MSVIIQFPFLIFDKKSSDIGVEKESEVATGFVRVDNIQMVGMWNNDDHKDKDVFNGEYTVISLTSGNEYVVPLDHKVVVEMVWPKSENTYVGFDPAKQLGF